MLQFSYPPAVAENLIVSSPLGFVPDAQQFAQLSQQGVPDFILKAIEESARRSPAVSGPIPIGVPPAVPGTAGAGLIGRWVAEGGAGGGLPYRCVITFADTGAFTSAVWVGGQLAEQMSGSWRLDGGRLTLSPAERAPFDANMQMQFDSLMLTLPNFTGGVMFVRETVPPVPGRR